MAVSAQIFSINRGSLHDGPGIRTVVYFSGCSLRCQWCHNPEGFDLRPRLQVFPQRCIGCGHCLQTCPEHHILENGQKQYLRQGCKNCGRCAQNCPADALQLTGKSWEVEPLVCQLLKDQAYYAHSGGGVTLSGGECLLQPDFVRTLSARLHAHGIQVLAETALHVPLENLALVAPEIDIFYADLKHMDPKLHTDYTGADNRKILENLRWLAKHHSHIVIRTPLIPGVNDSMENLLATARFAKELGPSVKGYVLLPYNDLAESKYGQLGLPFHRFSKNSADTLACLCRQLNQALETEDFVRC